MKCVYSYIIWCAAALFCLNSSYAQFPPRVGLEGSRAIHKDSLIIKAWANQCEINRGWIDIRDKSLGHVTFGLSEAPLYKADGSAISLGDGGSAVLAFEQVIINGPGPDFVVFENAFDDYFLELAHVEVSSNGEDFVRFPSNSLTSIRKQKGSFDTLTTSKINNLAGKYKVLYGTPFDLQELHDSTGININSITHIRIVDVVGSIDESFGSRDVNLNFINDPFPTPFPSGGFDLDAVGIINMETMNANNNIESSNWLCYPYPAYIGDQLNISNNVPSTTIVKDVILYNQLGCKLNVQYKITDIGIVLFTSNLQPGNYYIKLKGIDDEFSNKLIKVLLL